MNLTRFEVRWAEVIGRTLVPRGAAGGTCDAVEVGVALAAEVRDSTWFIAVLLRFGLWVVWLSPPFVLRRLSRFGALGEAERCTALEKLLVARPYAIRMAINFLKVALCGQLLGEHAFLARLDAYDVGRPAQASVPAPVESVRSAS